ncbi:molybdate ABC transporter substrate-binding protein [Winogradskyella forsetii]|uniref:molybdate ABC transporter substrate-binding protein n=1 Tax=Winogradskyella forsetii TaxID=2686077 RepID=UPI0015CB817A|nr:substrate-binding domain-containing protein [Winogradskyella forsetii]
MKREFNKITVLLIVLLTCSLNAQVGDTPEIQGLPKIYSPDLLNWKTDFEPKSPDLTEPTSNRIYDLHMQINDCNAFDLVLSTSGNYHMALTEFWYDYFLPKHKVENWFFSTSPPIGYEQTKNSTLSYSNVALNCQPHLAVGPKDVMDNLRKDDLMEGEPIPMFTNRGNVLVVKKGNPKNIKSIWDLERPDVILGTSNPYTEPGSFGNYANSIYNIALNDKNEEDATKLFLSLFGKDTKKWVTGKRIHHREVPHLVYSDQADVGIVFYHLARYFVESFPDEFEIVPLGGTVETPEPLAGNKIGKLFIARIKTALTDKQQKSREALVKEIAGGALDEYLLKHHIDPID